MLALVFSVLTLKVELTFALMSVLCALLGAVYDVLYRRIPNLLSGSGLLLGLVASFCFGGWRRGLSAAAAAAVCGLVFLVFYFAGGMGAGDVKLITAVGCLAGWANLGSLLVLTAFAGGALAVMMAVRRGRVKETLRNVGALLMHHTHQGLRPHPVLNLRSERALRLPYGVAIAMGSAMTFYLQLKQRG